MEELKCMASKAIVLKTFESEIKLTGIIVKLKMEVLFCWSVYVIKHYKCPTVNQNKMQAAAEKNESMMGFGQDKAI